MRNLKKFLALVLAMVMAFSLMLTASATTTGKDFSDASSINETFVEAAEVLTGMKVFQGDEEAPTFRPTDKINRAEVAALIYRLATGDTGTDKMDLYTTTHPFTDVGANDWFAGYVGYCWNAGYIKGTTATTFNPYDQVTGYETLAMVLRAMGYDANNEFTGPNWIVNVSATATQRELLVDVNKTHYANTLHQASTREVVASILFQAAQKTRVKYTPAFGYQSGDHTSNAVTDLYNDYTSLGLLNFGLTWNDQGVVIGNQQTGEKNTRLGFADSVRYNNASAGNPVDYLYYSYTPYAWENTQVTNVGGASATVSVGKNDIFNVETGIDLFGHNIKIWYDCRPSSFNNTTGRPVYAYYDKATKTEVVKADNTKLTGANSGDTTVDLAEAAKDADFSLNDGTNPTAVFSNSFSKFGSTDKFATPTGYGSGNDEGDADNIASPVKLYKLISNGNLTKKDDQLDVVISLNIETSRITESNAVNRVPTIGVPVGNDGTGTSGKDDANDTTYIDVDAKNTAGSRNVKSVSGVNTGVIAKNALVGNSTSTLGDYEFGVHITGTTPRTVSSAEKTAINGTGTETAYFLMAKVTPDVTGKVVAFNVNEGTVVLDNGTTLHRSKYYNTVVNTAQNKTRQGVVDTSNLQGTDTYALPQSIDQNGVESYNPSTYKFYLDFEGNYLGAERTHDSSFIYGTYLDYEQKTSSSTFTYYLTGVNLNGEVVTEEVSKYWDANPQPNPITNSKNVAQADRKEFNITGTNNLGVPYRDTWSSNTTNMNYIGAGKYTGFTLNDKSVDYFLTAPTINQTDYFVNMERIGVYRALQADDSTSTGLNQRIIIDKDIKTLGAIQTEVATADGHHPAAAGQDSNLYLTEDTKFIVVDGYGTDTVTKTKVYNGLSELLGSNGKVTLKLAPGDTATETDTKRLTTGTQYAEMTYYTKSPYIYAQSGDVCEKVDVIILPKAAVETETTTSSLYYMGDPNYSLISSHKGEPVYQYTIYKDGVPEKVWLTNDPNGTTNNGSSTDGVFADTFLVLGNKSDTLEPTTGGEVYTARFLNNSDTVGSATDHTNFAAYNAFKTDTRTGWPAMAGKNTIWANASKSYTVTAALNYSATTRNAQAATFTWTDGGSVFLRVAEAGVTNLNADNAPSKLIWPGITDLATLNEAGSINPVTGRPLKVAAQLDPSNPLVVTHIYVCWDQTQP